MKKLFFISAILLTVAITFTSCGGDDDPVATCNDGIQNQDETGVDCGGVCEPCTVADEHLSGMISEDKTLTADRIWVLNQKVVVNNGVTLTIEPGTIIKASEGSGSLASALVVARGGKVMAQGTASTPIIFTSILDNIQVNETAGTNLGAADMGLWGGLIILGNAPCSFEGDVAEFQIEGIPADDTFGLYGGSTDDDNSGVYQYISIRHGGALIGADNEINGLTLGGVGSETTIDHIEVVANQDDGVEFFGGTVNASELLVWAQGDDGLDIDQAYSGTVSNSAVILGADSDHGMEIDGPEGSATGSFTLNNITLKGNADTEKGEYADYRSNAMGTSNNVYAYGFKDDSDVELDNDGVATNYNDGLLTFGTWEIVLPSGVSDVADIFKNKADTVTVAGFGDNASAVTEGSQTVGADMSQFDWTFAKAQGAY